MTKVAFVIYY